MPKSKDTTGKNNKSSKFDNVKKMLNLDRRLRAHIEPDVRPFNWSRKRRPKLPLETLAGEQQTLFMEDHDTMLDENILWQLLKKPISYHRILADISGTVHSGLFLSQCFTWAADADENGWFTASNEAWTEQTGLNYHQCLEARKNCKQLGLLEEEKEGSPPTTFYKLNVPNILLLIRGLSVKDKPQFIEFVIPADNAGTQEDLDGFFMALKEEVEKEQTLFNMGRKYKSKMNKAAQKRYDPVMGMYHLTMYRICYMINNEQEAKVLTKRQIGSVINTIMKLKSAGADLTQLTEFESWWASTWMSRQKGTGSYQPPRPEQILENWFVAMQYMEILRNKPDEADKQAQIASDILSLAMIERAESRLFGGTEDNDIATIG